MGINKPSTTTKPNATRATRSNSSQSGKIISPSQSQRGTLKIPKRQSSKAIDKSGPYGFIVHDCNKVQFGFGNFTPEEELYIKFNQIGLTSTRNACFILGISLTNETCTAAYKYLNNRDTQYPQTMTSEYIKAKTEQYNRAKSDLEILLYNPNQSLDEYNVAKTIEKIIKFKLIQPNQTSYFFVSIDAPNSPIGSERWHQDSTNISIISDKNVGNTQQTWRDLLNKEGITHKMNEPSKPIRSDFVLIEYLNEGVSTTVEITGNVNTRNPDNIARFNTIPGSVILIENPGRQHTPPYICKSNPANPNSVDRTAGDKSLQIIMDEKSERTLYRTQLTIINDTQFNNVSKMIPDIPQININVNVKDIIPFDEISMTDYCSCKREDFAEYGGKRNKHKSNKARRKYKRRRSKRTQRKMRIK